MNPQDRPYAPTPARQAEVVAAPATYDYDSGPYQDAPGGGKKLTLRVVLRAVKRHWWQAGLLWLIGTVGLMSLAYLKVKPTYTSFAQVRVEPEGRGLLGSAGSNTDFLEYKETQVNVITSPSTLDIALEKHPELHNLPRFARSEDINQEMKNALKVEMVRNTNLILILMTSEFPHEARDTVNAVLEAYIFQANLVNNEESKKTIDRLVDIQREQKRVVDERRNAIRDQLEKVGLANVDDLRSRDAISVEEYASLNSELTRIQLDIVRSDVRLAQLQNEQPAGEAVPEVAFNLADEVAALYQADPRVIALEDKLSRATQRIEQVRQTVRDPNDPALRTPRRDQNDAKAQLDAMWIKMRPQLEAKARKMNAQTPVGTDMTIREAEAHVQGLKAQEANLTDKLQKLKIRQKDQGAKAISLEFDRSDLATSEAYLQAVSRALADKEFETRSPIARIREEFRARMSNQASTSSRTRMMAMAPVGMLFGVLGLLVLLELHAGRVVDPDDLMSRIRLPVLGVVPPLPRVRSQPGIGSIKEENRSQRQLDQFVQSLDHLRVALTSSRDAWGRERRCILITSACGAEGKTTLAAQLAERCVNSGLRTLLIDGDLRNPTLTRMFDVPDQRGLINVLRGEASLEETTSVVGGGGGFHFMPAGTPKVDPSRLLHGERLGTLLTRAREVYDLVIVDAPPVLPVPDALTIGRWTDGAVLAVRSDTSRFPLVEKAHRRLATVGVQVIGAVVNGVRLADAAYGAYYPSHDYGDEVAASNDA